MSENPAVSMIKLPSNIKLWLVFVHHVMAVVLMSSVKVNSEILGFLACEILLIEHTLKFGMGIV